MKTLKTVQRWRRSSPREVVRQWASVVYTESDHSIQKQTLALAELTKTFGDGQPAPVDLILDQVQLSRSVPFGRSPVLFERSVGLRRPEQLKQLDEQTFSAARSARCAVSEVKGRLTAHQNPI